MKVNLSSQMNQKKLLGERLPKAIRLKEIHRIIQSGSYPTTQVLADALNADKRTITRDIRELKETHGLPVEYDARYRGYYYSAIVEELPYFEGITEEQILAFIIALTGWLTDSSDHNILWFDV